MWTTKKTALSGERLSWRRGKDPAAVPRCLGMTALIAPPPSALADMPLRRQPNGPHQCR